MAIAKRAGAPVVAIVELANEIGGEGVDVFDPNSAARSSSTGAGSASSPPGTRPCRPNGTPHMPAGLVINFGGKTVYHLGDTALFSDLALVPRRDEIDVALMCIGGHYTMDRHDAVAAADLVKAHTVIPCHYGTFPPIETDAAAFKADVEGKTSYESRAAEKVVILEPGETHSA